MSEFDRCTGQGYNCTQGQRKSKSKRGELMNISNIIAQMITEMLEDNDYTDIKRNELALSLGCVPSQINYVITSRFTPEHGYIVESRRGGGGYIRIHRKVPFDGDEITQVIKSIGDTIEEMACRTHIKNLLIREAITANEADLLLNATSENCYRELPVKFRDTLRASILKQLLLTIKKINLNEMED